MDPKILFDYFKSIAEREGRYHDHKENTAWACLVLHLAFCGVLLHFDDKVGPMQHSLIVASVVAVIIATVISCLYMRKQLQLKDIGGAQVGVAAYFMSEMVTSPTGNLLTPLTPVKRSDDKEMQWSYVMPGSFVELTEKLNKLGRGAQTATRIYMYGLLLTASASVIACGALRW